MERDYVLAPSATATPVTCRPSIAFFPAAGVAPLFLLLACDGVFDTMENSIVGSLAHKHVKAAVDAVNLYANFPIPLC